MTILELENKLKERLNNGQNQEHDEELFLEVLVLLIHHPEDFKKMLSLYMASLSEIACKEAAQMTSDFFAGKIKYDM